jgi:uncharacterized protein (TIGR03437 family)
MKALNRHLWTLMPFLLDLTAGSAGAQSGAFIQVQVTTNVDQTTFYVDNTPYQSSQVFRWQIGDVHTLRIPKFQIQNNLDNLNNPPVPNPGNDVNLGVRTSFQPNPQIQVRQGTSIPIGTFADLTTPTSPDYVYRIQVWSFLEEINLTFVREYRLRFVTPAAGCAPNAPGVNPLGGACGDTPGYTAVDCTGGSYTATTGDYWCQEGNVQLTTVPARGYAFKDWNSNPGIPNPSTAGITGSVQFYLNSPFHIQVNFGPGKFYRVNTEPRGLEVIIDRSIVKTGQLPFENREACAQYGQITSSAGEPINVGQGGESPTSDFCTVWLVGGTRILGAREWQQDTQGKHWAFDSWSFGGGQNALFEVSGANLSTDVITARFLPAAGVTFVTQPQVNLPLLVNNRTWPSYNFWFGLNKQVTFSAPNEVVDANGRRWRFRSWSNGGPATQTLTITQAMVDNGLYLVAQYDPLNKLSIETNPPGLPVTIDGQTCQTPCAVERLPGESVTLVPAPSVTQANVLRLEFAGWNDGAPAERRVGFVPEFQRLVANYKQLYRLTATGNPPQGASFTFSPAAPDNFYDLDTRVTVTARANNGFRFRRWSGDTAGMFPSATVIMGGPRGVVAELEAVPFLDPAGIKNAAGTGPEDEGETGKVAPGSLITIYGVNLTPKEEVGPRSPQAQTLAEVAVRVGQRLLPLSYASGHQINAQLPFDVPLGRNRVTVIRTGQPEVSGEFEVVRNAPGLFGQYGTESEGVPPFGLIFRADGSVVTEAAPGRPGEVLSVVGTGIGPFRTNPPAGFALPAGMNLDLVDPVEIVVGDQVVQPLRVFATPGFVGMTSIQFRVGPQFPPGESTSFRIRVNGKNSNTVRLLVR